MYRCCCGVLASQIGRRAGWSRGLGNCGLSFQQSGGRPERSVGAPFLTSESQSGWRSSIGAAVLNYCLTPTTFRATIPHWPRRDWAVSRRELTCLTDAKPRMLNAADADTKCASRRITVLRVTVAVPNGKAAIVMVIFGWFREVLLSVDKPAPKVNKARLSGGLFSCRV